MTNEEAKVTLQFGQIYGELQLENESLHKRVAFLEQVQRASDSIIKVLNQQLKETKLELAKCQN